MRAKVIVTGRDCLNLTIQCLTSIAGQDGVGFDVCVVDDDSEDEECPKVVERICNRRGWSYILNHDRRYALYNQVAAIRLLGGDPEDPLIFVDRDDRFAHNHAVRDIVADYQRDWQRIAVAGSFICDPVSPTSAPAVGFPFDAWRHPRSVRGWMQDCGAGAFSHPRSFRRICFDRMTELDWTHDGKWFTTSADVALTIPAMEMAGPHGTYVSSEVRLVYTADQPWSDWHKTDECNIDCGYIFNRPSYPVIPFLELPWGPS